MSSKASPDSPGELGFKLSCCRRATFNDLYASFLPTFIPTLISKLQITMTQAGFLSTFLGIIHIIVQPVIGYMSDRSANSWLIVWGPVMTCLGASMIPLSPSYGMALLFVGVWAFGSAMFTPGHGGWGTWPRRGSPVARPVRGRRDRRTTVSPLFAVALVNTVGYRLMPVAALIPVIPWACS